MLHDKTCFLILNPLSNNGSRVPGEKKGELANAKGDGDSEGMEREERGEREWKESKKTK